MSSIRESFQEQATNGQLVRILNDDGFDTNDARATIVRMNVDVNGIVMVKKQMRKNNLHTLGRILAVVFVLLLATVFLFGLILLSSLVFSSLLQTSQLLNVADKKLNPSALISSNSNSRSSKSSISVTISLTTLTFTQTTTTTETDYGTSTTDEIMPMEMVELTEEKRTFKTVLTTPSTTTTTTTTPTDRETRTPDETKAPVTWRYANDALKVLLLNYWKFNGNYVDLVSNKILIGRVNVSFTADRHGNAFNAVALTSGKMTVRHQHQFGIDMSFAAWIYVLSDSGQRQPLVDCYRFSLELNNDQLFAFLPRTEHITKWAAVNVTNIARNAWTHIAITFNFDYGTIWYNAIKKASFPFGFDTTNYSTRTCRFGYTGLSGPQGDIRVNFHLDDIMFFNRSLTQLQLEKVMKYN